MNEKEEFALLFYDICNQIKRYYPNKANMEREIMGRIINNFLHEVQHNAEKMTFVEFYKLYLKGTPYLDSDDFTNSEKIEIINESPLNERDKKLARMYWVDVLSEEVIAEKLQIDRKTVRNNTPKISMVLRLTASKMYK